MSNAQRRLIEKRLPGPQTAGRPSAYERREAVQALCDVLRTGCSWRSVPHDFPPWRPGCSSLPGGGKGSGSSSMSSFERRAAVGGGRHRQPRAAIIDSQSVKTTDRGASGYDAGKKVRGRKRPILVDVLGLIIAVIVPPADIQDRDGARLRFERIGPRFRRLRPVWADGGSGGAQIQWVWGFRPWRRLCLEIVKRTDDLRGFKVLPRRWIVERTFGWLSRYRRLSKDDEHRTDNSEVMLPLAMIHLMVRRLA